MLLLTFFGREEAPQAVTLWGIWLVRILASTCSKILHVLRTPPLCFGLVGSSCAESDSNVVCPSDVLLPLMSCWVGAREGWGCGDWIRGGGSCFCWGPCTSCSVGSKLLLGSYLLCGSFLFFWLHAITSLPLCNNKILAYCEAYFCHYLVEGFALTGFTGCHLPA